MSTILEPPAARPRPLTREEEADRALKHTDVSPGAARALCLLFLLTLFAVPCLQHAVEIHDAWVARQHGDAHRRLVPQCWDVLALLPTVAEIRSTRSVGDALRWLPAVAEIRRFENALEDESVLSRWLLPRVQLLLTGVLGAGNEQAYCGRDRWLVYRPEVDYLTGPAFLDPRRLRRRTEESDAGSPPVQPDPLKAILHFHRQLAQRGIGLVVFPVPLKPMIHPEKLSPRFSEPRQPLQNGSYGAFVQALEQAGIPVFDASQALLEAARRTGQPQYLETDTHWTPQAAEMVAAELARFVADHAALPPVRPPAVLRRRVAVANLGDIAVMLKLPPGQRLFRRQRVELTQVLQPSGAPWQPQRNADVLLLGDSFSNIYSLKAMGWGESAGLAEHLSAALRRPLDCIVVNAGGAYAARQRLCQELARGEDRLAGKRLVIWEFAMRDLSGGDWRLMDLPHPHKLAARKESAR